MSDDKATALTVLSKTVWSDTLFSFTTTRPDGFRFEAGQFVRLGVNPSELHANQGNDVPDERIFRAYSVASSPYDEVLEFFSVVVPDGAFTSQLQHLQVGDTLWLNPMPFGFLTLSRYQEPAPKTLWLLSTGTGLAPFLSMLQDLYTWENYQNIILVYSARTSAELAFQDKIHELAKTFSEMSEQAVNFRYIPIVTREAVEGCLQARIPTLIERGELEQAAGLAFDADSHVMLCGNPQMVDDTKEALKAKGLTMNRRGVGNIAVENYW
ncbi:ferredoxin--NADP reductase [uncultured Moraxella sp.]|uniref:ferredoxin--NADP reductase n=1 Tax=uncultured Moraxella sp. TaxID=263769 RepID=UPI0025DFD393|nr:ferredoxin--NADP reductase [uncultured Moraxella sp.]